MHWSNFADEKKLGQAAGRSNAKKCTARFHNCYLPSIFKTPRIIERFLSFQESAMMHAPKPLQSILTNSMPNLGKCIVKLRRIFRSALAITAASAS